MRQHLYKGDHFSRWRSSKNEDPEGKMNLVCSRNNKKTQVSGKRLVGDEPRPLGRPKWSHRPCRSQQEV